MKAELEDKLIKAAPHLYADAHEDMTKTAMCWGMECDDGWYRILLEASIKLENEIKKWLMSDVDTTWGHPRASQVKEKYGTLQIYLTHGNDEMFKICDEAEKISAKTCEHCGKKGKLYSEGWCYTACPDCHMNREARSLGL